MRENSENDEEGSRIPPTAEARGFPAAGTMKNNQKPWVCPVCGTRDKKPGFCTKDKTMRRRGDEK
jgi:rubredoxin